MLLESSIFLDIDVFADVKFSFLRQLVLEIYVEFTIYLFNIEHFWD